MRILLIGSDNPWRMESAVERAFQRAGAFYLGHRTPGVAAMLTEGEHCAWYDDAESCIAECTRYLAQPDERMRIRVQGERFVRAHHTYDQRIENLPGNRAFVNPLAPG